jgi:predicted metal-dependent hydrolase
MCDEFYEGGDPQGINLVLWHVAEEFEHRASAHRAFGAASGNYFMRIYGMLVAFWHVLGFFGRGEKILLQYYRKDMSADELKASKRVTKKLFRRQIIYLLPRMLKIVLPGYDPAKLKVPQRISNALDFFNSTDPITRRYDPVAGRETA